MRKLLVIGAGRSASSLIGYLLDHAASENWSIRVGDVSEQLARSKTAGHPAATAFRFDIEDREQANREISAADLVISMLPAHMHIPVAEACVEYGRHLVTASYVSPAMNALHQKAVDKGVLLLNECGLDPGLDHMSAMEAIRAIQKEGNTLTGFYSYTGGLVAPESNDNPWGYKFSWNPRNVILAGQGTARYIESGKYRYIPYQRLFSQAVRVTVDGYGSFDGYANRDSLSYRKIYGLNAIPTLLRGTLRQEGFCSAWQVFVALGLTDDSYVIDDSAALSYADTVEALLPERKKGESLRSAVARVAGVAEKGPEMDMVEWTGIFSDTPVGLTAATPAQILQQLLESKWKLNPGDKDMIVMQHRFEYENAQGRFERTSSLVVKGRDEVHTAMAQTVGLPVAIAARLILKETIRKKGVIIPVDEEIAKPILSELETFGVTFTEKVVKKSGG